MNVLLYARYSTEKQDSLTIDTQLTMCRRDLDRNGWQEVGCFSDEAVSGATSHRPGFLAMMAAIDRGHVDMVFADAMDRLSRSQADIATLYERLTFRGILLQTRKEGVVTPLHIGMMGTINAQQLSATSDKTRDALRKRHEMGRNPGGSAYGYEKRIEHDAFGERIKGLLQIVPSQAAIVVRICADYADGLAPHQIALRLNADGVPPPRSSKRGKRTDGKPAAWGANTITGHAARGTGISTTSCMSGAAPIRSRHTARIPTPVGAMPSSAMTTIALKPSRSPNCASCRTNCGRGSRTARPVSLMDRSRGRKARLPCPSSLSSGRNI